MNRNIYCLAALAALGLNTSVHLDAQPRVQLFSLFDENRMDNFTTTDPRWLGTTFGQMVGEPLYRFYRVEGQIFRDPQPGTVPLKLWWSEGRGDNFTTTSWSRPGAPGYVAASRHVEGHVFDPARPQPAGTIELWSVWSPTRHDNFLTTDPTWWGNTFGQRVGPADHDYVFARREGWIFPLIEVQLTVGDNDLREGGNMVFIKLNLKNGTSTPEIVLGRSFRAHSNVRVPLSFTQSFVVSDIASITVRHDGSPRSGHPFDTYANWNLQDFLMRVPGGQIIYDSRRDRRLPIPHRFTGDSRDITLSVP